eukprot:2798521-Pleurochrysis_carterae.AAC.1
MERLLRQYGIQYIYPCGYFIPCVQRTTVRASKHRARFASRIAGMGLTATNCRSRLLALRQYFKRLYVVYGPYAPRLPLKTHIAAGALRTDIRGVGVFAPSLAASAARASSERHARQGVQVTCNLYLHAGLTMRAHVSTCRLYATKPPACIYESSVRKQAYERTPRASASANLGVSQSLIETPVRSRATPDDISYSYKVEAHAIYGMHGIISCHSDAALPRTSLDQVAPSSTAWCRLGHMSYKKLLGVAGHQTVT